MPYKISGTTLQPTRVIVVNESDWSVEHNQIYNGSYEIDVTYGSKIIIGRLFDGQSIGFGNMYPVSAGGGDRGIFAGGHIDINTIEYITISTTGDATDFGDLAIVSSHYGGGAASNGGNDRGIIAGGDNESNVLTNVIEYITISTPGDSTDFGDLITARQYIGTCDNGTGNRGLFAGGEYLNVIEYITISTPGDAADFGDMSVARRGSTGTSNDTNNRGIFAGGQPVYNEGGNVIDYVTITSTGDANDFGDLTFVSAFSAATSNGTNDRGLIMGSYDDTGPYMLNNIDYITISTISSALNFGDLSDAKAGGYGTSNKSNNRGIFAGGILDGSVQINAIDYVTISSLGDAQDFGDLSIARYYASSTSNA